MSPQRKKTTIILVLLLTSSGVTGRMAQLANVRTVDIVLLLTTGILLGVLLTTIVAGMKENK